MFLYVFLGTIVILALALVVFVKTSTNPVAKFLNKKMFGKKQKKAKLTAIIVSGASGSGKGTIINKLKAEHPTNFEIAADCSPETLKGTSAASKVAIVELDVKAAKVFKDKLKGTEMTAIFIFLKAPNAEELEKRLRSKGGNSDDQIKAKLAAAVADQQYVKDNESLFDRQIENKAVDETYNRIKRFLSLYGGL